jgi:hypothetical protein
MLKMHSFLFLVFIIDKITGFKAAPYVQSLLPKHYLAST